MTIHIMLFLYLSTAQSAHLSWTWFPWQSWKSMRHRQPVGRYRPRNPCIIPRGLSWQQQFGRTQIQHSSQKRRRVVMQHWKPKLLQWIFRRRLSSSQRPVSSWILYWGLKISEWVWFHSTTFHLSFVLLTGSVSFSTEDRAKSDQESWVFRHGGWWSIISYTDFAHSSFVLTTRKVPWRQWNGMCCPQATSRTPTATFRRKFTRYDTKKTTMLYPTSLNLG